MIYASDCGFRYWYFSDVFGLPDVVRSWEQSGRLFSIASHSRMSGFSALVPKRDSCEWALWYPPDSSSRMDHGSSGWFVGDDGMNQRLRPLSCFLTLAVLAVCSTDAVARGSHKHQHGKKSHEASGVRYHRHAALKKARHAKHVGEAQRKSTPSSDAPPPSPDTPPLSGDLEAVRDAIVLARK